MSLNDLTIERIAEQSGRTPDELRDMIARLDEGTPPGLRGGHFDRQGQPMTFGEWAVCFEVDRVVKQTKLDNDILISTVWLGIDHGFGRTDKPLIFETMVAVPMTFEMRGEVHEGLDDMEMERFTNEAEAVVAHDELVEKWKDVLAETADEEREP